MKNPLGGAGAPTPNSQDAEHLRAEMPAARPGGKQLYERILQVSANLKAAQVAETVMRSFYRPRPWWLPASLYRYLCRRLFVIEVVRFRPSLLGIHSPYPAAPYLADDDAWGLRFAERTDDGPQSVAFTIPGGHLG